MPKPKTKHPKDMTTEEAVKHLFPSEAVAHARKHADLEPKPQVRRSVRSIKKDST